MRETLTCLFLGVMDLAPSKGQQACRLSVKLCLNSANVVSNLHDCLPKPLNPQKNLQSDSQLHPIPLPFSFRGITVLYHIFGCTVRAHFLPAHNTTELKSKWGSSKASDRLVIWNLGRCQRGHLPSWAVWAGRPIRKWPKDHFCRPTLKHQ